MTQNGEVQMVVDIDPDLKQRAKIFAIENETTLKKVVSFALKAFLDHEDGVNEPVSDHEVKIH